MSILCDSWALRSPADPGPRPGDTVAQGAVFLLAGLRVSRGACCDISVTDLPLPGVSPTSGCRGPISYQHYVKDDMQVFLSQAT